MSENQRFYTRDTKGRDLRLIMLQKIQDTIQKNHLFSLKDKILVAVSGGADSIILAYSLYKLGYTIGIVHCNFQLRGEESDREESFVKTFAAKNRLPFFCKRFNTQSIVDETHSSIQVVARNLRYAYFEEILNSENYNYCALAHHADDQAETLFMSLLKGNSPQIWKPIPIKRSPYVRPLLELRKAEILEMAAQYQLDFCTDSSNLKNDYSRNYTRNVVFPLLAKLNSAFVGHLLAKNDLYQQQITFIHSILDKYLTTENEIDFASFINDFGETFLEMFILYFCQQKGITGYLAQDICNLKDSISGKYINLPNGKMTRTRTGLLYTSTEFVQPISQTWQLKEGTTYIKLGDQHLKFTYPFTQKIALQANTFYINTNAITFPLTIRPNQQGDKMMPLGMKNYKKISDIMIDNKYSPLQKQNAFVIEDVTGEIIALSGFRISEKVKIREGIDKILAICIGI